MSCVRTDKVRVLQGSEDQGAGVIYVIDSPDHPFDVQPIAKGLASWVVTVPVANWNDALTPWPAPGLYREDADFGGMASTTLHELLDHVIPLTEQRAGISPTSRAICGYSLGGLFSLYAFTHSDAFVACGCLSGSVWYQGWVDHLRSLDLNLTGRFAMLSVGTKEKRGGRPIMRTVQDNMQQCASILQERGAQVTYVTGPGNHLQFIDQRYAAGLTALGEFLAAVPAQEHERER